MNDPTSNDHPLLAAALRLSDDGLIARVEDLARGSRAITVELLVHLGELERRKLHRGQGCGRLFAYCTEVLKFSETEAYHRLQAARAARRFPLVLDLVASGRVNLTTVRLLAPHLTEENHRSLLGEAAGLKRHEVEKIVARLNPQPDVPSSVRKLPSRKVAAETPSTPVLAASAPVSAATDTRTGAQDTEATTSGAASPAAPAAARGKVAPLRPCRYKLEVTLGEEEHDDLCWLQDAMRREIPDGDPAAIVRGALKAWRAAIEKKRFCATERPRSATPSTPGSRHISADVQRQVWKRDDGCCAFVAKNGRRCSERSYLEYHHEDPYAIGGEATVARISLRCRAHNVYEAELDFGAAAVAKGREAAVARGREAAVARRRERTKSGDEARPAP